MNKKLNIWDIRLPFEQELSSLAERILENHPSDNTYNSSYKLINTVTESGKIFKEDLKNIQSEINLEEHEIEKMVDEVVGNVLGCYLKKISGSSINIKNLIEVELTSFINLYGRKECEKIMQILNDSKLFNENIDIAMHKKMVPDMKLLNGLICSCSYKLAFAKQRKVNFAALYFLLILYQKLDFNNMIIDEGAFMNSFRSIII